MKSLHRLNRNRDIGWTVLVGCLLILLFVVLRFVMPTYVINSGSMTPTLPQWSLVVTAPVEALHKGDIITFRHNNEVITHTYLGEKDGNLITRGDANPSIDAFDPALQRSDVIGKVVVGIPPVKMFVFALVIFCLVLCWPKPDKSNDDDAVDVSPVPEDVSAQNPA